MALTDGLDLISPQKYGENGPPHDAWTRLRAESPVHRCEPEGYPPFWAITRHADICEMSKRPDTFSNEPGIVVIPSDRVIDQSEGIGAMRTIIQMDPPEHRKFRKVASPFFTPRALGRIDAAVDESARSIVDQLAGSTGEGECDFATDVAAAHPLRILSTILGVPREEEPLILRLTNELFAADDPELQREGEDRDEAMKALGLELFQLFNGIIEDRRANPRDDLASVLANGKVDGQPMGPMETFGYYLITFSAGHDTTKNALVTGMNALVDHPEQLAALRANPKLVESAVEEIVRWATPVNYMQRTALRDVELGGQAIRKGDSLVMFYASANRDEAVFDQPFDFRVDRQPNRHLGFGIGEHFCLGSNLARLELRVILQHLRERVEDVELAGAFERMRSSFLGGVKRMPIRVKAAS